ncbi:twin-arginine translocase subunit TatB [Acinetobacter sp. 187]|nr:twin-arginine translocase subunit TatB [Acinetobacter lanii]
MLNVGMTELLCFAIIALLVLGPEKLPEAARFTAKWYGKAKRMISSIQTEIDQSLKLSEFRAEMQKEIARMTEIEQRLQQKMDLLNQQYQTQAPSQSSLNSNPQSTDAMTDRIQAQIETDTSAHLSVIPSLHQWKYAFIKKHDAHYERVPFKQAFIQVHQQLPPTLAHPFTNNTTNLLKIAV